ncbi:MAG: hypothetical protein IMZ46_05375, partial [Acidobacteria bacterium]|nr:hypothetical protein [Acidobacteriota bacterium]
MKLRRGTALTVVVLLAGWIGSARTREPALTLNDQGCFEARGVNVLVFSNWYSGEFSDSKLSGVE